MVIDKGLLVGVAATVTFLATRALERYRRKQTVIAEIGKARASALIRVLSALSATHELAMRFRIEVVAANRNPDQIMHYMAEVQTAIKNFSQRLTEDSLLVGPELSNLLLTCHSAITEWTVAAMKADSARVDLAFNDFTQKLHELYKYLPEMPKPD